MADQHTDKFGVEITAKDKATPTLKKTERGLKTFETRLKSVNAHLKTGVQGMASAFKTIVPVITAAGAAGLYYTTQLANQAQELKNLEQITGASTTRLQEFSFIERELGLQNGLTARSFKELGKRMYESAVLGTGEARNAFAALKMDLKDGNGELRDTGSVFDEIMSKLSSMPDGAEKTTLSMKLLGEEVGFQLIPALNRGAKGFESLREAARESGEVLDDDALDALVRFRVASQRAMGSLDALGKQAASVFVADLEHLATAMDTSAKNQKGFVKDVAKTVRATLRVIATITQGAIKAATYGVETQINSAISVISKLFSFATDNSRIKAVFERIVEMNKKADYLVPDNIAKAAEDSLETLKTLEKVGKVTQAIGAGLKGVKLGGGSNELQKWALDSLMAIQRLGDEDFYPSRTPDQDRPTVQGMGFDPGSVDDPKVAAERKRAEAIAMQAEMYMLDELAREQRQYEERLALLQKFNQSTESLTAQHEKKVSMIQSARQQMRLSATSAVLGGLLSLSKAFGSKNVALEKGLGIAQVIIDTNKAVMRAYASHGATPLAHKFATAARIQGAASIASIVAVSPDGGGGAVGGGSGGGGEGASATTTSIEPIAEPTAQRKGSMEIHIHSDTIIGTEEWVRENLSKSIKEAMGDGVDFGIGDVIVHG